MRKWCLAMLVVVLLVSVSWAQAPVVFKSADNQPDGYPTVEAVKFLGKVVEEATKGKYKIQVYPGAQLGSEKETIEQALLGAIEMVRCSTLTLSGFYEPMGILSLPYLFRNYDHQWQAVLGAPGQELIDSMSKNLNLVALAWFEAGARSFYTIKAPIMKPEDVKGLKIRVPESPVLTNMVKFLGGAPVHLPFGEVYSALQTGVVDGAENNPPSYYAMKHFEVAKHYSLDEHTRIPELVIMSKSVWEKLSPEEKMIFKMAGQAASVYQRILWKQFEERSLKAVQEGGAKIYNPDKGPFQQAIKPFYDQYSKYKELIDKILAVK
ncbi:MAG: TRAP transporter substrate-binding protein [Synergistetes bacterium]|nr:TRAP transporter substrate-binding protein [Synergistota bacterium]MDW8191534.1 TRAP transporter substrate-binding protein [Synergistota bacterium]